MIDVGDFKLERYLWTDKIVLPQEQRIGLITPRAMEIEFQLETKRQRFQPSHQLKVNV